MATIKISRDFQCLFARTCSPSTRHTPGKKGADSRRYLPRRIWNKPRPHGKNHVGKRLNKPLMVAKKFPDNPFEPVPLNRLSYSVDTYSQPITCGAVRQIDQAEVVTTHPFPLLINQSVLPGLDQQPGLRKGLGFHAVRAETLVRTELDSQPLPALGPTTVDESPSVFCLHSGPEAMGTVPFEIAGLKSSLAHDRLPFSLLLRPLVGRPHIFAVLQQLEPCVTHPYESKHRNRKKIRPATKLAILLRAMRHVKHFPKAVTDPKIPCQGRTTAGQKPA